MNNYLPCQCHEGFKLVPVAPQASPEGFAERALQSRPLVKPHPPHFTHLPSFNPRVIEPKRESVRTKGIL